MSVRPSSRGFRVWGGGSFGPSTLWRGIRDNVVLGYAAKAGLVFVTSDERIHAIAIDWLAAGRTFRMVFWKHKHHARMSDGDFIAAFEELAAKADAFEYPIEYIKPKR